jgi:hypothetical protein
MILPCLARRLPGDLELVRGFSSCLSLLGAAPELEGMLERWERKAASGLLGRGFWGTDWQVGHQMCQVRSVSVSVPSSKVR